MNLNSAGSNEEEEEKLWIFEHLSKHPFRVFLIILGLWAFAGVLPILGVFVGSYYPLIPQSFTQTSGTIGDTFGMANTLFSALALFMVAYTVYLQRNELMLQRRDIRLSREAQEEQAKHLQESMRIAAFSQLSNFYFAECNRASNDFERAQLKGYCDWANEQLENALTHNPNYQVNEATVLSLDVSGMLNELVKISSLDEIEELAMRIVEFVPSLAKHFKGSEDKSVQLSCNYCITLSKGFFLLFLPNGNPSGEAENSDWVGWEKEFSRALLQLKGNIDKFIRKKRPSPE